MTHLFLALFFALIFLLPIHPALAGDTSLQMATGSVESATSARLIAFYTLPVQSDFQDLRVVRLNKYLESRNSDLAPYSEYLVKTADEFDVDWRLVPAISGVESSFCKHIPNNSYNCWGWANGKHAFTDYPDGIYTVTRVLRQKYVDRGLDTPERMSPVYAPPSTTWAGKVRHFMTQIDEYEHSV